MDMEVTIQAVKNTDPEEACNNCMFAELRNCVPLETIIKILGLPDCYDEEGYHYIKKENV